MEEAPLILFELSLKQTVTTVYEEDDKRETHPWWTALPIKSPVLTLKPGDEESASFWSEIRDNLVSFHADYGFGFHDTMMSYLRSGVEVVVGDNSGAGVVSVSVEMHLFTENTICDSSDQMFGEITSFRVEAGLESRVHNLKRFKLLSHGPNQEVVEEEEGNITCAICLEDLFGDDQVNEGEGDVRGMKLVSCSHVFHEDCLVDWLKEKDQCPLCRHPSCLVVSTDDQDQVKATV